jgi:hypothetical protein
MSSIEPRLRAVAQWWRPRRLSLSQLDGETRWIGRVAIAVAAALCVLIAFHGVGIGIPLGSDKPPGMLALPRLAELLVIVALGTGAAAAAVVSLRETAVRGWLLLVPFALLGIAVGGELRAVGQTLGDPPLLRTGGWVVAALAAAPLVIPRGAWGRRPALVVGLAAAPYAATFALYLLAGSDAYRLSQGFLSANPSWGDVVTLREAVVRGTIEGALLPAAIAVNLLVIWQVIETVRATRDAAAGGLHVGGHGWTVLGIALLGKVIFLVVFFPSARDAFVHSRHDGPVSWLLAAAVAGLVTLMLLRRPPPLVDRDVSRPATAAVIGLVAGLAAIGVALVLGSALAVPGRNAASRAAGDAVGFFDDLAIWLMAVWPFVMTAVGIALLVRRRTGLGAAFLAFGVWGLPRAVALTGDLFSYGGSEFPVGRLSDYIEGAEQYPGWVDVVTLDAVVTVILIGLAVAGRLGRQRAAGPNVLLFVLVLSTMVAHAGALIPGNWRTGQWFYLALVFPVAYGFLLGARPLNEQASRRELKVLGALALTTVVLAMTTIKVFNGDVRPGALSDADAGKAFLQVPLVFLLGVMGVLALRRSAASQETPAS